MRGLSPPSSPPVRLASPLGSAAVFGFVLVTQTGSRGGCTHARPPHNKITSTGDRAAAAHSTKCGCPTRKEAPSDEHHDPTPCPSACPAAPHAPAPPLLQPISPFPASPAST